MGRLCIADFGLRITDWMGREWVVGQKWIIWALQERRSEVGRGNQRH
jgi:hypothetical protein